MFDKFSLTASAQHIMKRGRTLNRALARKAVPKSLIKSPNKFRGFNGIALAETVAVINF